MRLEWLPGPGGDPSAHHFWHSSTSGLNPAPSPQHAELHTHLQPFRSRGLGEPISIMRDWAHMQRKEAPHGGRFAERQLDQLQLFKIKCFQVQGSELFSTQYPRLFY